MRGGDLSRSRSLSSSIGAGSRCRSRGGERRAYAFGVAFLLEFAESREAGVSRFRLTGCLLPVTFEGVGSGPAPGILNEVDCYVSRLSRR